MADVTFVLIVINVLYLKQQPYAVLVGKNIIRAFSWNVKFLRMLDKCSATEMLIAREHLLVTLIYILHSRFVEMSLCLCSCSVKCNRKFVLHCYIEPRAQCSVRQLLLVTQQTESSKLRVNLCNIPASLNPANHCEFVTRSINFLRCEELDSLLQRNSTWESIKMHIISSWWGVQPWEVFLYRVSHKTEASASAWSIMITNLIKKIFISLN